MQVILHEENNDIKLIIISTVGYTWHTDMRRSPSAQ